MHLQRAGAEPCSKRAAAQAPSLHWDAPKPTGRMMPESAGKPTRPPRKKAATRQSRVTEGQPDPLGATWDGLGVNFALFSANATRVELCLFDSHGNRELERIALPE